MEQLKQKIENYKQYPLSDNEIQRITGHKLIIYLELHNFDTFEHLLHMNNGSVIIMYMQTSPNVASGGYGHYCCINKISDKEIEFYDPYGLFPDKQLKFSSKDVNKQNKQDHTYLSWLMYNSPYKLSFNEHKFQAKALPVQTCGWFYAHMIKHKSLPLKQYKALMDNGLKLLKTKFKGGTYDDYIVVNMYDEVFKNKAG
jgi:hypothetical protein